MHSIAFVLIAAAGPATPPAAPIAAPAEKSALSILYTGDTYGFHGRQGMPGGFARRQAAIDRIRARQANVLLVDSGNSLGQFYYSRFDRGGLAAELMATLSYDAVNLGTHEFDYGMARLLELGVQDHLPFVSSNVVTTDGKPLVATQINNTIGGVRVAIVGVCDERAPQMTMVGAFAGLKALPALETLRKQVAAAHKDHDLIVVLSNVGYYDSVRLAKEIPDIDVVIARSRLAGNEYEHNQGDEGLESAILNGPADRPHKTLVVVASRYGYYLGHIQIALARKDTGLEVTSLESASVAMSVDAEEIRRRPRASKIM